MWIGCYYQRMEFGGYCNLPFISNVNDAFKALLHELRNKFAVVDGQPEPGAPWESLERWSLVIGRPGFRLWSVLLARSLQCRHID